MIDLEWRPDSYWDWPTTISPNIKGEQRRRWLKAAAAGEGDPLEEIPSELFGDSLDEPLRQFVGRIHPSFMGGEYLPDYRRGEVEIARVSLQSTTGDVTSIRARPLKRGIGYRIVDEYPLEWKWRCRPAVTKRPLTLAELIRMIDTAEMHTEYGCDWTGLVESQWRDSSQEFESAEQAVAFASVSSEFYPQLAAWYRKRADLFIQEWNAEHLEDEENSPLSSHN